LLRNISQKCNIYKFEDMLSSKTDAEAQLALLIGGGKYYFVKVWWGACPLFRKNFQNKQF